MQGGIGRCAARAEGAHPFPPPRHVHDTSTACPGASEGAHAARRGDRAPLEGRAPHISPYLPISPSVHRASRRLTPALRPLSVCAQLERLLVRMRAGAEIRNMREAKEADADARAAAALLARDAPLRAALADARARRAILHAQLAQLSRALGGVKVRCLPPPTNPRRRRFSRAAWWLAPSPQSDEPPPSAACPPQDELGGLLKRNSQTRRSIGKPSHF